MLLRLHHAQLTIPLGAEASAREFYCGFLGLPEVEKPDSLIGRDGFWVQIGDQQVHFGTETGVERTATKAHLAYEVRDLVYWKARLLEHGRDPFGNRVEFIQAVEAA